MSIPAPPVAIGTGGCSAIYQDTLYSYTQDAFQSLPLQPGAKWSQHGMGVEVNGSRCVVGTQAGQDVLFIIGGSTNTTSTNYSGLQRWGFQDNTWQTITFGPGADSVLANRLNHGATFLNDSSAILVYSGYQDNSGADTSQTFTITTTSPALAQSYVSNQAPPGIAPMLLPWNSSHAVMAGGSANNQQVWTFGIQDGWHEVQVVLPHGLPNMSTVEASLLQGDNGSKILDVFDLSQNPNTVTGLLLDPGNSQSQKREPNSNQAVDLTNQPAYNSTFAPKETRSGYSLAQGDDGLVVMTGGISSSGDSIALFNQTGNTWVDGATFFNPSKQPNPSQPSSVPSSTPSNPVADPVQASSSNYTRMILGAVLGSIFGAIALGGIVFLICLYTSRRMKKKRSSVDLSNKGQITRPMQATGINTSPGYFVGQPSPSRRYFSQRELRSPDEMRTPSPSGHLQPPTIAVAPASREPMMDRSDQGWSRYFDGRSSEHDTTRGQDTSDTARLTAYTETSEYSTEHDSAEVAPLGLGQRQPRPSHETFLESAHSSQGEDTWDPIRGTTQRTGYGMRAPSSVYDESINTTSRGPHPGDRVVIPSFPGVPASRTASIVQPTGESDRGMRTTASHDLAGIPESRSLSSHPTSIDGPPSVQRQASGKVDDMSWLNLKQGR